LNVSFDGHFTQVLIFRGKMMRDDERNVRLNQQIFRNNKVNIILISLILLRKYNLSSLTSCVMTVTITGILMCKPCQSIEFVIKEIALKVTLDSDSICLYNPARLLISLCSAELMMIWVVNTFTRLMPHCHSDPCYSFLICMLNYIRFIYLI
jgi:hypothetical protein